MALAGPLAGQAAVPNHLNDKFQVSAALTALRFTTVIRVDTDQGAGTEIDAESDLGVSRTVPEPRFGVRWGISRRHSLEIDYQFARRNGDREITREIEFEGETYTTGLQVRTTFDSDLASLVWRWALHASDKSRIGATLGLGTILFRTSLDGYASVNDQQAAVSAERNLTAPVGGVGVFGRWHLSPQWYLEADARGIYIPIDRFEAFVADLGAAVRWFPWCRAVYSASSPVPSACDTDTSPLALAHTDPSSSSSSLATNTMDLPTLSGRPTTSNRLPITGRRNSMVSCATPTRFPNAWMDPVSPMTRSNTAAIVGPFTAGVPIPPR